MTSIIDPLNQRHILSEIVHRWTRVIRSYTPVNGTTSNGQVLYQVGDDGFLPFSDTNQSSQQVNAEVTRPLEILNSTQADWVNAESVLVQDVKDSVYHVASLRHVLTQEEIRSMINNLPFPTLHPILFSCVASTFNSTQQGTDLTVSLPEGRYPSGIDLEDPDAPVQILAFNAAFKWIQTLPLDSNWVKFIRDSGLNRISYPGASDQNGGASISLVLIILALILIIILIMVLYARKRPYHVNDMPRKDDWIQTKTTDEYEDSIYDSI